MTLLNGIWNGKENKNVSLRNGALHNLSNSSKTEVIEGWLIDKLAQILAIEPNQIDVSQDFDEYGLDSAEAINLSGELENYLGCRLSPTLLWDYQNIETLAKYLATNLDRVSAKETTTSSEVDALANEGDTKISPENYVFAEFPEYQKLSSQLQQVASLGNGNPFLFPKKK